MVLAIPAPLRPSASDFASGGVAATRTSSSQRLSPAASGAVPLGGLPLPVDDTVLSAFVANATFTTTLAGWQFSGPFWSLRWLSSLAPGVQGFAGYTSQVGGAVRQMVGAGGTAAPNESASQPGVSQYFGFSNVVALRPHKPAVDVIPEPDRPEYQYLGAKQRSSVLPAGAITMGARVYVPQHGRFLQMDPVYGASANPYDYAYQDPANKLDLDGRDPHAREAALLKCKFWTDPKGRRGPGMIPDSRGYWAKVPCRKKSTAAVRKLCYATSVGSALIGLAERAGVKFDKRMKAIVRKGGSVTFYASVACLALGP